MKTTTGRLRQHVEEHRDEILALATERGAYNVRLIGSAARGDDGPDSDIDFVVRFEKGRTLRDHVRLIRGLEALLGTDVDVVSEGGLRPGRDDGFVMDAVAL